MAAGAAACGADRVQTSMFQDSAADETAAQEAGDAGKVRPLSGPYRGDAAADEASGPDASEEAFADAGADVAVEAAVDASIEAAAALIIPDGDPDEICAPFTCELGRASCLAAVNGGVNPEVAVALYTCAATAACSPTALSPDAMALACAAAALASHPTAMTGPTSLCSGLVGCITSPLTANRCEVLYSGLTPMGANILHDRLLECGAEEESFVRETLSWLAYP